MKVAKAKLRGRTRAGLLVGLVATVLTAMAIVAQPAHATSKTYRIWSLPDPVVVWTGGCVHSDNGAYNTLKIRSNLAPRTPCDDISSLWVFEEVDTTAGGTTLYNIRHAGDDKCVGVEGVESGDTHIGQRLQLEGCENRDDGRWYLRHHPSDWPYGQRAGVYIHNYSPNHRDLVWEAEGGEVGVRLQEYPDRRLTSWNRNEV